MGTEVYMDKRVLLITGASSGIGKATAIKAADAGFKLILTARSKDALKELVQSFGEENALAVPADITSFSELENVVKKGIDKFGKLDAVFANAGKGLNKAGVENGDPEEWSQMIDLNVKALIYTAKVSMKHLKESKGHFLITSSVAGKITLAGSIYGASKWFASGFGKNLSKEMKEWGGRCTTICPGMVDTPFFDQPKPDKLKPEDIADAALFALQAENRASVTEIEVMPRN